MPAGAVTILGLPRRLALAMIAVLVTGSALVSFAESFRALYEWAANHGLSGGWALVWPLQVDVFIAVGELGLFVALADRWVPRSRLAAWAVTLIGLAVSVAGNVGHVTGQSLADRATAAVPPLAAAAALAVGLGVLKRVVEHHHAQVPAALPTEQPEQAVPGTAAKPPAGQPPAGQPPAKIAAAGAAGPGAPRPRRKVSRPLEHRPAKVRNAILADLAAGRAISELAREHKVSASGMRGFARRHRAEVAELAASNGHAAG